ncbi:MAG: hypothetical protein HY791_10735 [Deltaproteobacteria bacterium]|nr:hypothetical protein [Deltaproteobacteria bacterium]
MPMEAEAADPETVDADVEISFPAWAPVTPQPSSRAALLALVDGVRRLDARLVADVGGQLVHAALASVASGSVTISDGVATFDPPTVVRVLAVGSGESADTSLAVRDDLIYEAMSWPGEGPDAPLRAALERMRRIETKAARDAAKRGALVLADGPIEADAEGTVVGYVKRIERLYVPTSAMSILARMKRGQRSPLFLLKAIRSPRYGWFLRLADPLPGESPLSGVARLEVLASRGKDSAVKIADTLTSTLPPLAPSRARDPRSPQNLMPIGALETYLRRLLGDQAWIRRLIRARMALAEQESLGTRTNS